MRLNAQRSGAFDCSGALFFVRNVLNQTTAPLRVDTIEMSFTKVSGAACVNHTAPIASSVGMATLGVVIGPRVPGNNNTTTSFYSFRIATP